MTAASVARAGLVSSQCAAVAPWPPETVFTCKFAWTDDHLKEVAPAIETPHRPLLIHQSDNAPMQQYNG